MSGKRPIEPVNEEYERGLVKLFGWTATEIRERAITTEKMGKGYADLAELGRRQLRDDAEYLGRGRKWSITYNAKRDQARSDRYADLAKLYSTIADEMGGHVCGPRPDLFDGECAACDAREASA